MRIRNLTTPERDKDYKKSYIPLVRLYTHLDQVYGGAFLHSTP